MSVRVSVVTLTHNKLDYTRVCLGSLLQTAHDAWEIVVVDNGSSDGTREWLDAFRVQAAARGVDARVIANPANIGCSTARNQGWRAARGEYVVFADNDVAPRSRSWLGKLVAVLDADPRTALAGPKLVYPFPPHDIQCAGVAVSRTGRVQFRGRGEPRTDPRFNAPREVQCLISACCMARRAALEQAGGFDEAFNPVEYEDLDLCYRLRDLGWRVVYEPAAEMYHFESVTTAGTAALPNTYLIIRHGLLFKRRWRHRFEKENGPPDTETCWRRLPARRLAKVDGLPLTD